MPRVNHVTKDALDTLLGALQKLTGDTLDGITGKAILTYSVCVEAVRSGKRIAVLTKDGQFDREIFFPTVERNR